MPVARFDCNFNFQKPFWFIITGVVLDFAWVESKKKGSILSVRVILSFSGGVSYVKTTVEKCDALEVEDSGDILFLKSWEGKDSGKV